MKNLNKIVVTALLIIGSTFTNSCNRDNTCEYVECEPTCNLLDDFENQQKSTFPNWKKLDNEGIDLQTKFGSTMLHFTDDSGVSLVYNNTDFPKNLPTAGCALIFDMAYDSGAINDPIAYGTIGIHNGTTPLNATANAVFVLNSSNPIVSLASPKNIEVPLVLATGTTLPSNSYGTWVLSGAPSTLTAADIATFNTLIQNISGVYFNLDNGGNPVEEWWVDNFCFKQCCN